MGMTDKSLALLDRCAIGVVIVAPDLRPRAVNREAMALLGLAKDADQWPRIDTLAVAEPDRVWLRAGVMALSRLEPRELELCGPNQQTVWARVSGQPCDHDDVGLLCWIEDITALRATSEALRASEERLDLAVAGTRSAIWQTSFPNQSIWWSKEFYPMLGYRDGHLPDAEENPWERHIHPEDINRVKRGVANYLRGHTAKATDVYEATYRMCRLDSSIIWVTAKGRRNLDADGRLRLFNGILLDVTAQRGAEDALRRAQQNLIQAEKMASLGSLVAGVAHEINTPLGNTLTASSHMHDKITELRTMLDENRLRKTDLVAFIDLLSETTRLMVSNCERAAELVQSFKQVAVDQTSGERRTYDLKRYIDEILVSLRPSFRKTRHQVRVECPENLEIDGFPGAMSQVLTNFLMNSLMHAYAPEQAGTLLIRVSILTDGMVELIYSDDGRGIRAEHLGRIYDPFFTTARSSGGSGLGLHIVYNIVTSNLQGTIDVKSEVGRGTSFILRFPRRAAPEITKEPAHER